MRNSKSIIIDGKSIGAVTEQPSDRVFLGIEVSKERAEYLIECLERPLCLGCHREEDECDADPCIDKRIANGEVMKCEQCNHYFDPVAFKVDGRCEQCSKVPRVFAVHVFETITYTGWIRATNEAHVEQAVELMDCNDWEPMRASSEFEKYGYTINNRTWNIVLPTDDEKRMIPELEKRDLVIPAEEWIDDDWEPEV